MNIEALQWKYPEAQFAVYGERIYQNIQWVDNSKTFTESQMNAAETEYDDYLKNVKPLEESRQSKIQELRNKKIDELILDKINAVNNAQNQTAIDAVTL